MNRLTLSTILMLMGCSAQAQLTAPVRTTAPISDPSMIVMDRGAKLEVIPTKRAVAMTDSAGRVVARQVTTSGADAAMDALSPGVVFNHAMQQEGYISGEITFMMKPGRQAIGFDPSSYPGLKKITGPAVYAVNARTPTEFIELLKRLQARSDLEWVEPTVTYGGAQPNRATQ
jgi:hypothetical protein